jgi:predicted enzyme related to lactoylglutathione lyase
MEARVTIKGQCIATIFSEDLNNLLPFYRDVLGLAVGHEGPGFVTLGPLQGPSIGLGTHSEVHGRPAEPARHIVGLETDDIQADYRRLKDRGVEFLEEPTSGGPVTFATLKDPDGNYVQLIQFNAGA